MANRQLRRYFDGLSERHRLAGLPTVKQNKIRLLAYRDNQIINHSIL